MAVENAVCSITVHLDSGATLNGYVYQGNAIDDGFWLTYSSTADMGSAVVVSREKIQYIEITGVVDTACASAHGVGDLIGSSLRWCGCNKFSVANYTGMTVHQLRQLQKDLIEEYMNNRDIEWFSEQSRLIDAATQIAYSKGRY